MFKTFLIGGVLITLLAGAVSVSAAAAQDSGSADLPDAVTERAQAKERIHNQVRTQEQLRLDGDETQTPTQDCECTQDRDRDRLQDCDQDRDRIHQDQSADTQSPNQPGAGNGPGGRP